MNHIDGHIIRRRRGEFRACVVVRQDGYPYECVAADKNPDDDVWECTTHGCWWHTAPNQPDVHV